MNFLIPPLKISYLILAFFLHPRGTNTTATPLSQFLPVTSLLHKTSFNSLAGIFEPFKETVHKGKPGAH